MTRFIIILILFSFSTAYAQQAPRRDASVVREALVFPYQSEHAHGSSVVELPNGDLLMAWFQGSGERNADDVRILGSRLKKGITEWSDVFDLADTPHLPDCNPVLFMVGDTLHLVWIAVQANLWQHSILRTRTTTGWAGNAAPKWNWQDNILLKPGESFLEEVRSKLNELPDLGQGWSEYAPEYDDMIIEASKDIEKRSAGWMTRIKPLMLANGEILLPLYSDGFNMSMLAISENEGKSWKPSLPIVGRGPIQPALAQRKDGTLVAYMRDSGNAPNRIQVSESKDQGRSWSVAQRTEIPNTASVEVVTLEDGRWFLLGNDIDDGRYQLSLFVSHDEGKTWPAKLLLEDDQRKQGGFSYPSMIVGSDGLLHISYSSHLAKDKKSIKYISVSPFGNTN